MFDNLFIFYLKYQLGAHFTLLLYSYPRQISRVPVVILLEKYELRYSVSGVTLKWQLNLVVLRSKSLENW